MMVLVIVTSVMIKKMAVMMILPVKYKYSLYLFPAIPKP